jgi:hypothetical protein
MQRSAVALKIPARPDLSPSELENLVGFGEQNGGRIANLLDGHERWQEEQIVWFYTHQADMFEWKEPFADREGDVLHSLYHEVTSQRSTFVQPIGIHGLYCLALYLKDNSNHPLTSFSGIVYGFGSAEPAMKTVINRAQHIAFHAPDLRTPGLYIENGRPKSIYWQWHSDQINPDCYAYVYSANGRMFSLEEEQESLAA